MTDFMTAFMPGKPADEELELTAGSTDEFADIMPEGTARLRDKPLPSVPSSIVRLAQAVHDGIPYGNGVTHIGRHQFKPGEEARRDAFVKHMRNASAYLVPAGHMTVVTSGEGDLLVTYRASKARTRQS